MAIGADHVRLRHQPGDGAGEQHAVDQAGPAAQPLVSHEQPSQEGHGGGGGERRGGGGGGGRR